MNITRTHNTLANSSISKTVAAPAPEKSSESEEESGGGIKDTFYSALPYGLAAAAAVGGIVGGFSSGPAAALGRAVSFAGVGAGLGFMSAVGADTSGDVNVNYEKRIAVGASILAPLGALAFVSHPATGLITGAVGALGAAASGMVFQPLPGE